MFTKSVDQIVRQFQNMISDLEAVVAKTYKEMNENQDKVDKLENSIKENKLEIDRANSIKSKITSIIK